MARIKIELPERFHFTTELEIQIGSINYGGHLGNDSMLMLVHEARIRFLKSLGYRELDIEGVGIIMADVAAMYRKEAFHGETLVVKVGVNEFSRAGCAFHYQLSKKETGEEVARVKTGIVFMNYETRKTVSVPERFKARFLAPGSAQSS